MLSFYQHLPEYINPIAFSIGSFNIRWYSLMYLAGFFVVYILLKYKIQNTRYKIRDTNLIIDFLLYSFAGLIIGARLGYVLFYNFNYFFHNPLEIISPFNSSGNFTGIFGMSYFGGLIGIGIASLVFCGIKKIKFWQWADFAIPAIPAGYFFGRIGNFLNGELFGKITEKPWGMYFNSESFLRHPTQLYEALLEGLLLFIILWLLRGRTKFPGYLLLIYLFGYGIIRFFIEFLREPEGAPLSSLTTGQILSIFLIFFLILLFFKLKNKQKTANIN
ncbi:MAG: prolipoprotein diacylglyceryl transferase [Patescibacteria group bacterium]